jgi:hypothetical protein
MYSTGGDAVASMADEPTRKPLLSSSFAVGARFRGADGDTA